MIITIHSGRTASESPGKTFGVYAASQSENHANENICTNKGDQTFILARN